MHYPAGMARICGMNKKCLLALISLPVLLCIAKPQTVQAQSALAVGARKHVKHSTIDELPFEEDDMSYLLAYEFHERESFWQIAVGYTPDATGLNESGLQSTDYVITPELNLMFQDNAWQAGAGILKNYVRDESLGSEWSDLYWQLIMGLKLSFVKIQASINAYYTFESWSDLNDFESDDIEFGAWLKFSF